MSNPGSSRDTEDDEAAIRELLVVTYAARVNAHDAAGYANDLYADDVLWAPPDAPDRTDRAGIQAAMSANFERTTFRVRPSLLELRVMGDFAYAIGNVDLTLTPKGGGDAVPARFRILWLLEKQSPEGWRISRQIWNKKPVG